MKYIYFVSFSYSKGIGNTTIKTSEKIDDIETLREVEELIAEKQIRITKTNNN